MAPNGPKWPQMANFHHILDVFSGLNDQIDLNPFASCQASSDTSLEYPHGIFWRYLKIAIFCPMASRAKNGNFQVSLKYPMWVF